MKAALRLGDSVTVNDRTCEVASVSSSSITLIDADGLVETWLPGALIAVATETNSSADRLKLRAAITESDNPAMEKARILEQHILEATTGVPLDGAMLNAAFDPLTTNQAERDKMKLEELSGLGIVLSLRSWQRLRARYRSNGISGLVDKRSRRSRAHQIDQRVVEATAACLAGLANDSTRSKQWAIDQVRLAVSQTAAAEDVRFPSRASMYRLIDSLSAGRGSFGEAPTRRSIASGPKTPFGNTQGYRPGERVEIDSTRADILVLTNEGRSVRPELTVAVDSATRTICAATLDYSTSAADLSVLLAEIVAPRRTHPDGLSQIARRHDTVDPKLRLSSLQDRLNAHAEQPIIVPSTIVADLGAPYRAMHFRTTCETLGISLELARVGTPTDKAIVERTIGSMNRELFQYLPGYVGRNAAHRGRHIEGSVTLEQLQDLMDEWIAVRWQKRSHDGLRTTWNTSDLSPNAMAGHFRAITGEVNLPLTADDYIELQPMKWVSVQRYGVNLDRRVYDSPALNLIRSQRNPDPTSNGKWELHYNPRDLLEAWLRGPDGWIRLDWIHRHLFEKPFGHRLWEETKKASTSNDPGDLARMALARQQQSSPESAVAPDPRSSFVRSAPQDEELAAPLRRFNPDRWD